MYPAKVRSEKGAACPSTKNHEHEKEHTGSRRTRKICATEIYIFIRRHVLHTTNVCFCMCACVYLCDCVCTYAVHVHARETRWANACTWNARTHSRAHAQKEMPPIIILVARRGKMVMPCWARHVRPYTHTHRCDITALLFSERKKVPSVVSGSPLFPLNACVLSATGLFVEQTNELILLALEIRRLFLTQNRSQL